MIRFMNINAQTAQQSEETLLAALEKLDAALSQRRFLVAGRFSRADLTACDWMREVYREYRKPVPVQAQAAA
jgi:glutathione S-transferase